VNEFSRCKGESFNSVKRYTIQGKSYIIHTHHRIQYVNYVNLSGNCVKIPVTNGFKFMPWNFHEIFYHENTEEETLIDRYIGPTVL